MRLRAFAQLGGLFVVAACTQILGIDGRYELADGGAEASTIATGGRLGGTGGREIDAGRPGGAGGTLQGGSGGVAASGGSGARDAGGSAGNASGLCSAGMKRCVVPPGPEEQCVTPDPSVGCSSTGCEPCPFAPNPETEFAVCVDGQCAFECRQGFIRDPTGACVPEAMGAGGGGGATSGCMDDFECPPCAPFVPGCCSFSQRCGCLYVAACI